MCEEVYRLHGVASDVQHHLFFFIGQLCKCIDASEHNNVFFTWNLCLYVIIIMFLLILFISLNNNGMSGIGHYNIVVVMS